MHEPGDRDIEPVEGSSPSRNAVGQGVEAADDPYEELESVFDQPIFLEEADLVEPIEVPDEAEEALDYGEADRLEDAIARMDEVTQRLSARLEALEGEVRGGSERTLEALRRLGERMGAELGMLDKRAINLELTLARLRSVTEAVEAGVRRLPETGISTSPPPSKAAGPPPASPTRKEPDVGPKPAERPGPPRLWPPSETAPAGPKPRTDQDEVDEPD